MLGFKKNELKDKNDLEASRSNYNWSSFSLRRDLPLFSTIILFIVVFLSVWFALEAYKTQRIRMLQSLRLEASQIDRSLVMSLDNAEYIMKVIGEQIINLAYKNNNVVGQKDTNASNSFNLNNNNISQILKSYSHYSQIYSFFSWIDSSGNVIASSRDDLSTRNVSLSDRGYFKQSVKEPWKMQLGEPVKGRITNRWVVPVALGVTNDSGDYMGTIQMSVNIDEFYQILRSIIDKKNTNFAIASQDLSLLSKQDKEKQKFIEKNFIIDKENRQYIAKGASDGDQDGNLSFVMPSSKYRYFILVAHDKFAVSQEILEILLPRIVQIVIMGGYLLALLMILRLLIIKPLEKMTFSIRNIVNNKIDNSIITNGPEELQKLYVEIESLKEYIAEKQKVEKELRYKINQVKFEKDQIELESRSATEFMASIGHDLRTPLNSIIGFSEMIQNQVLGSIGNKQYLDYANDINSSGRKLLDLLEDVLDISRARSGVTDLNESDIHPATIIQKAIKITANKATNKKITINTQIPSNCPLIHVDEIRIRQVIINLLTNSIKYSYENGVIDIIVERVKQGEDNSGLVIKIIDNGVGMSSEEYPLALVKMRASGKNTPYIYERYTNGNSGLGLTLAVDLLELHDAYLELESTKGIGTTVSVYFPASRLVKS